MPFQSVKLWAVRLKVACFYVELTISYILYN